MLNVEVDDRELRRAFADLKRQVEDFSPLTNAIGAEMERRMLERFETRTDPTGQPWRPLSPRTLRAKQGRGSILVDSGTMMDSRTFTSGQSSVSWGFGQPYAAYHEFGTRRMPRRGLLLADPNTGRMAEKDQELIRELLAEYLKGSF